MSTTYFIYWIGERVPTTTLFDLGNAIFIGINNGIIVCYFNIEPFSNSAQHTLTLPLTYSDSYIVIRQVNFYSTSSQGVSQRFICVNKQNQNTLMYYALSGYYNMFFTFGY